LSPPSFFRIAGKFDEFKDLSVETHAGRFVSQKCYLGQSSPKWSEGTLSFSLIFETLDAELIVSPTRIAAYWNVSLINFLANMRIVRGGLDRHPLRVFLTPEMPSDVPPERISIAEMMRNARNRLITFMFRNMPAFIEKLANYDDAEKSLKDGVQRFIATCVMVGAVPDRGSVELEDVKRWLPIDTLTALTIASGVDVGIGVIEIRDAEGGIIKRIHLSTIATPYHEGHTAISEIGHSNLVHSGIGPLIENVLSTSEETMKSVRIMTDCVIQAQVSSSTPDHAFSFVVRALDGLANRLSLNRRRLADILPSDIQQEVQEVLFAARDEILRVERECRSTSDATTASTLKRIASRAEQADAVEDSFGLSVSRVLKHYLLNDETAINDLYNRSPRQDGLLWADVLNKYRGGVIHKGFSGNGTEITLRDVLCYTNHLIDLIIRISLKEVGYVGTYNPLNRAAKQILPLDWVKEADNAKLFGFDGYEPEPFRFIERSPAEAVPANK
jgi:hypothetical protein